MKIHLHRGMIVDFVHPMGHVKVLGSPLHPSDTPVTYRRRPPLLGEHTDEVAGLRVLGEVPDVAAWHELVAGVVRSGACAA